MEVEDVAGKKAPVEGGGLCIYCGWDGGGDLRDEHTVPYSLGVILTVGSQLFRLRRCDQLS